MGDNMTLRYREDGTFRIVQFTDTHLGNRPYNEEDLKTFHLIEKMLEELDVDLIVHTGDIIWSDGVKDSDLIFEEVMTYFDKKQVPFAMTFGNHDAEGTASRKDLLEIYEKSISNKVEKKNHLLVAGRESYTLEILKHDSDDVANVIYIMDSGGDAPLPIGIYDWNQPEQVEWFREVSNQYRKGDGVKRNLIFQHIPIPEYWTASENIITGVNNETDERISAPHINTGLFANMVLDGETWGMFVGHDHENNFDSLLYDIHLVYGNVSGYNTYGDVSRGVRIIELDVNTRTIETKLLKADEILHDIDVD